MAKKKRGPRIVCAEAAAPTGYRWLRQHARGAKLMYIDGPNGCWAVFDEVAWAESLRVAEAREIEI